MRIIPFAYLLVLSVYLLSQSLLPEWAQCLADAVLNVPIYIVIGMLGVGRLLKLCGWFRSACLLPMATKVEGYIDSFVVTFTQGEVVLINATLGVVILVFLIASYRHFFV